MKTEQDIEKEIENLKIIINDCKIYLKRDGYSRYMRNKIEKISERIFALLWVLEYK